MVAGDPGTARLPGDRLSVPPSWGLDEPPAEPLGLFGQWVRRADAAGVLYPTSVTLSTATATGVVSARTVILKGFGPDELVFESETYSRKGVELAENPSVAMTLYWREVQRQVCVTGRAAQLPDETSDAMWRRRARPNQAAAVVAREGAVLADVAAELAMQERADALVASEGEIDRPPTYVAYGVTPLTIEFWEGSEARLHRRVFYERTAPESPWAWRRIQP